MSRLVDETEKPGEELQNGYRGDPNNPNHTLPSLYFQPVPSVTVEWRCTTVTGGHSLATGVNSSSWSTVTELDRTTFLIRSYTRESRLPLAGWLGPILVLSRILDRGVYAVSSQAVADMDTSDSRWPSGWVLSNLSLSCPMCNLGIVHGDHYFYLLRLSNGMNCFDLMILQQNHVQSSVLQLLKHDLSINLKRDRKCYRSLTSGSQGSTVQRSSYAAIILRSTNSVTAELDRVSRHVNWLSRSEYAAFLTYARSLCRSASHSASF
ncbi:hypothetical protein RRG08_020396 [Elysia crispata]|uniref:Uncharacterized protein n=1 Tax=Elysia crispata TaxID=231223 RepID=A0AAE0Y7Q6_9GAST|nr:hypothetical protein RRG08_020396 [Elysia crispata]